MAICLPACRHVALTADIRKVRHDWCPCGWEARSKSQTSSGSVSATAWLWAPGKQQTSVGSKTTQPWGGLFPLQGGEFPVIWLLTSIWCWFTVLASSDVSLHRAFTPLICFHLPFHWGNEIYSAVVDVWVETEPSSCYLKSQTSGLHCLGSLH